jgi:hypothetical protein
VIGHEGSTVIVVLNGCGCWGTGGREQKNSVSKVNQVSAIHFWPPEW